MSLLLIKADNFSFQDLEKLLSYPIEQVIVKTDHQITKRFCLSNNIEYLVDKSMITGKNLLDSYIQLINLYSPNYIVVKGDNNFNRSIKEKYLQRVISL